MGFYAKGKQKRKMQFAEVRACVSDAAWAAFKNTDGGPEQFRRGIERAIEVDGPVPALVAILARCRPVGQPRDRQAEERERQQRNLRNDNTPHACGLRIRYTRSGNLAIVEEHSDGTLYQREPTASEWARLGMQPFHCAKVGPRLTYDQRCEHYATVAMIRADYAAPGWMTDDERDEMAQQVFEDAYEDSRNP